MRLTPDERQAYALWEEFKLNMERATPAETELTEAEKKKKLKRLEADPVEWIMYFFRNLQSPNLLHFISVRFADAPPTWNGWKCCPGREAWQRVPWSCSSCCILCLPERKKT